MSQEIDIKYKTAQILNKLLRERKVNKITYLNFFYRD